MSPVNLSLIVGKYRQRIITNKVYCLIFLSFIEIMKHLKNKKPVVKPVFVFFVETILFHHNDQNFGKAPESIDINDYKFIGCFYTIYTIRTGWM